MLAICLHAPNDTNGNPRRVWLVYDDPVDGNPAIPPIVEGYAGPRGVANAIAAYNAATAGPLPDRDIIRLTVDHAPAFRVVPAEYTKYAKEKNAIHA